MRRIIRQLYPLASLAPKQLALFWRQLHRWQKMLAGVVITYLALQLTLLAILVAMDAFAPLPMHRYTDISGAMLDSEGRLMHISATSDGQRRLYTDVSDVSPRYLKALITFEDKRFYRHNGVDTLALLRAAYQAVRHGRVISGGSTLTMQAAKMLDPRPRTLQAKIIEIFRAWQLERHYTKDQILSIYLTLAPMGSNIEGVKTASLLYFNRPPINLTLAETALLVALPQNPSRLFPLKHPERAKQARQKIARRIKPAFGASDDDLMAVAHAPLIPYHRPAQAPLLAEKLISKGTVTHSSINRGIQFYLQKILKSHLPRFDSDATLAAMVVDRISRKVVGYVGNAAYGDWARKGYINMAAHPRSPGSTLKPFIYGLAMDDHMINAQTLIRDEVTHFGTYSPQNFNNGFKGMISIAQALKLSLNIPVVKVLERYGPKRFAGKIAAVGTPLTLPPGTDASLPIALGGADISLEYLMQLYTALADDGKVTPLIFTTRQSRAPGKRFISNHSRQQITRILKGSRSPFQTVPTVFSKTAEPVAFKTGTSYGARDAWSIGYRGRYVIGIWVGKATAQPHSGFYGMSAAAPIMMELAHILPSQTTAASQVSLEPVRQADAPQNAVNPTPWDKLPLHQQYFDAPDLLTAQKHQNPKVSFSYPYPDSLMAFDPMHPIALEIKHGTRPFQWYVNGQKLSVSKIKRRVMWQAKTAGFYDMVVIDKDGFKAATRIRLK